MRPILTLAFVVAVIAGAADARPNCKSGVPCGNTCISKGMVCHMNSPQPRMTAPAPVLCKDGKLCGASCIKKTDVCHKS